MYVVYTRHSMYVHDSNLCDGRKKNIIVCLAAMKIQRFISCVGICIPHCGVVYITLLDVMIVCVCVCVCVCVFRIVCYSVWSKS